MCAEKDTRRSGFPYDVDYPVSMHSQSMLQLLLRFDGRRSIFSLASLSDKERWASAQLHHKNQDNRSPGQWLSQLGSNRYEDLAQPDPSSWRISPLSNRLRQQNHQVPPKPSPISCSLLLARSSIARSTIPVIVITAPTRVAVVVTPYRTSQPSFPFQPTSETLDSPSLLE
jgi:hypothetical protein